MEWRVDDLVYGTQWYRGDRWVDDAHVSFGYRPDAPDTTLTYAHEEKRQGDRYWRLTNYSVRGYKIKDPGTVYYGPKRSVRVKPGCSCVLGSIPPLECTLVGPGEFFSLWVSGQYVCTYGWTWGKTSEGFVPVVLNSALGVERVYVYHETGTLKYWNYDPRALTEHAARQTAEKHVSRLHEVAMSLSTTSYRPPSLQKDRAYTIEYARDPQHEALRRIRQHEDLSSRLPDASSQASLLAAEVLGQYPTTEVDLIEDLSQVSGWGGTLRAFLEPVDVTPKGIASAVSGRYLSCKYGDMLTLQDSVALAEAWQNRITGAWTDGTQTRRASSQLSSGALTARFSLVSYAKRNDDRLSRLFMFAADRGFLPGLKNVWNLIPYSFVLDWFVNVQEVLEASDARVMRNLLTCLACSYSIKTHETFKWGSASVEVETYTRSILPEFPFPDANLHLETPSLNQLVTGSALLAQRVTN